MIIVAAGIRNNNIAQTYRVILLGEESCSAGWLAAFIFIINEMASNYRFHSNVSRSRIAAMEFRILIIFSI
jgi:hypothetical protein